MWKHLLKCANCPGTVKETVKQEHELSKCYLEHINYNGLMIYSMYINIPVDGIGL